MKQNKRTGAVRRIVGKVRSRVYLSDVAEVAKQKLKAIDKRRERMEDMKKVDIETIVDEEGR